MLSQIQDNRSDEIAWIRVSDAGWCRLRPIRIDSLSMPLERMRALSGTGKSDSFVANTARGQVPVGVLPIRVQLDGSWNLAEVAIYLRGYGRIFFRGATRVGVHSRRLLEEFRSPNRIKLSGVPIIHSARFDPAYG
jgi:hypothetical protein